MHRPCSIDEEAAHEHCRSAHGFDAAARAGETERIRQLTGAPSPLQCSKRWRAFTHGPSVAPAAGSHSAELVRNGAARVLDEYSPYAPAL